MLVEDTKGIYDHCFSWKKFAFQHGKSKSFETQPKKYTRDGRFHSKEQIRGNNQQTSTSNINILLMVNPIYKNQKNNKSKEVRVQTKKNEDDQYPKEGKEDAKSTRAD